jgi:hypothetical protein
LIQDQLGIKLKVTNREKRVGDVRWSPSNPDCLFSVFPNVQSIEVKDGLAAAIHWYEQKLRN